MRCGQAEHPYPTPHSPVLFPGPFDSLHMPWHHTSPPTWPGPSQAQLLSAYKAPCVCSKVKVCALTGDTPELCIKPAMGSWGLHRPLPCIATPEDLMLYALALQDRWPRLPADFLSTPHAAIDLPPAGNQQLMVEPFIHVAR